MEPEIILNTIVLKSRTYGFIFNAREKCFYIKDMYWNYITTTKYKNPDILLGEARAILRDNYTNDDYRMYNFIRDTLEHPVTQMVRAFMAGT